MSLCLTMFAGHSVCGHLGLEDDIVEINLSMETSCQCENTITDKVNMGRDGKADDEEKGKIAKKRSVTRITSTIV